VIPPTQRRPRGQAAQEVAAVKSRISTDASHAAPVRQQAHSVRRYGRDDSSGSRKRCRCQGRTNGAETAATSPRQGAIV